MGLHRDTRFWFSPIRGTITYREPNEKGHSAYDLSPPNDWRPLVVIDPESAEDVERVRDALWRGGTIHHWQAGLRKLANPTPPIEEPTGWGAVVEDDTGAYWTLYAPEAGAWINYREGKRRWHEINAVRILSEGVPAEADR